MAHRKVVPLNYKAKHDFTKLDVVIAGMKAMKIYAAEVGNDDIELIINSAFNLCFTSYNLALRSKWEQSSPTKKQSRSKRA